MSASTDTRAEALAESLARLGWRGALADLGGVLVPISGATCYRIRFADSVGSAYVERYEDNDFETPTDYVVVRNASPVNCGDAMNVLAERSEG